MSRQSNLITNKMGDPLQNLARRRDRDGWVRANLTRDTSADYPHDFGWPRVYGIESDQ